MRANYTLTPSGNPARGEGQLITNNVWYWIIVPALVIAGVVIVIALISLGRWSATPTAPENHTNNHRVRLETPTPQPQKIEVEVKGLNTAVSKLDTAVDRLAKATDKISPPVAPPPAPTTPTPTPTTPLQVEVSGSLAIRQQTVPTDICAAPKESLTPKEREWRFWNCPEK